MVSYRISADSKTDWRLFSEESVGFSYNMGSPIANVLRLVKTEFEELFGIECVEAHPTLAVLYSSGGPMTQREHNIIFLDSAGPYHLQQIYQFAHELCHFMVPSKVCASFRWFEESLCQAMSWFILRRIYDKRITSPSPELKPWYPGMEQYILNSMNQRQRLDVPISAVISQNASYLKDNCYDRPLNRAIAYELFPLLSSTSELWRIVPFLHRMDADKPLKENLLLLGSFAELPSGTVGRLIALLCE